MKINPIGNLVKTNPIQSQYKPNSRKARMNVRLAITRNYNNKQRTMNNERLCKTNPIQTQSCPPRRLAGSQRLILFMADLASSNICLQMLRQTWGRENLIGTGSASLKSVHIFWEIVAEDFYFFQVRAAKSYLPCCFNNWQFHRLDIDKLTADSFTGDWLGSAD